MFAKIETVESEAVRYDEVVRSMLLEACNESTAISDAIEQRLITEVTQFKEDLKKVFCAVSKLFSIEIVCYSISIML